MAGDHLANPAILQIMIIAAKKPMAFNSATGRDR
jgi:hypothetical protein